MKKNYIVTLRTLSPLFIGSGEKLRKSEYLYNKNNRKATIINQSKLVEELQKKNLLDEFIKEVIEKKENLYRFLSRYQLPTTFHKYTLFLVDTEHSKPINDLSMFAKNGLGEVYVPGSSLKGALRTCMLNNFDEDHKDNDLFRHISVSDSEPIGYEHLAIYQKIDYASEKKGKSKISLYRECIKPGTIITFNLTIDDKEVTIETIELGIKNTQEKYYEWSKGFRYGTLDKNKNIIYFGGGVGFVSKTLHYKTSPKDQVKWDVYKMLKEKYKLYGKMRTIPNNVPIAIKLANHNGKFMEMGRCEINFKEISR